jgi:(2Fe-2S) ferredoxin
MMTADHGERREPEHMITVCRDCCCGSTTKHPSVDHHGQLARLRDALGDTIRVRVSTCLDRCAQSNVVVVNPSPAGRRAGGRPAWLGLVLDPDAIDDVIAWVRAGGPGIAEPPATLDLYAIDPPPA